MPSQLLFSANPFIKLLLQAKFFGDVHYVWCSESCDSGAAARYTVGALIPPTSNPRDIYQDLKIAIERHDRNNAKIAHVKLFYVAHATELHSAGKMSADDRDELIYMVNHSELTLWRPLQYVFPKHSIGTRLKSVPPSKRASHGMEYIVEDLERSEFDIVEL